MDQLWVSQSSMIANVQAQGNFGTPTNQEDHLFLQQQQFHHQQQQQSLASHFNDAEHEIRALIRLLMQMLRTLELETKEYVHIRVQQQRNGRKSVTTVQGLKKEYSYTPRPQEIILLQWHCRPRLNELGQLNQLQGDQRKNVSTFLVQAGLVEKDNIKKIHGF